MKLKSARFKNLIGLYRASGKSEIYIDFTKCLHNIILLIGPNGSGKSTLMNVLNPLPDNASMYLPDKEGLKEIEYIEGNDIYRIKIIYPITTMRTRGNTKAFLTKIEESGEEIEFNPNGNIGSFKNELYIKFNLDPNFISLSRLSVEDRGIVDKTPAERKKFVNNILESVEVYNDIFKSLSKRSTVYRSMINSIVAKIDSIGNEEQLIGKLNASEHRLKFLNDKKNQLIKGLSDNEAIIKITDPDGSIQMLYNELHSQILQIDNQLSLNEMVITNYNYKSKEEVVKKYNQIKTESDKLKVYIESSKSQIQNLLINREEESKSLQLKIQRLDSLKSDYSFEDLKANINKLNQNQKKYIDIFKMIGLENFSISKDEYIIGLTTLKDLKDMVDTMRSYADNDIIQSSINYINDNFNVAQKLNELNNNLISIKELISDTKEKINYYNGIAKTLIILNDRPNKCTIDDCPFIKDAVHNAQLDPNSKLNILERDMQLYLSDLNNCQLKIDKFIEVNKVVQSINIIIRSINNSSSILSKLPNGNIFGNINTFIIHLKNGHTFNEINELYQYLDYANILEEYKNEKEILIRLESEYKIYENKHMMIDDIVNETNILTNRISSITTDIETINKIILDKSCELDKNNSDIITLDKLIEKYIIYEKLNKDKVEILSKINNVRNNMNNIESAINNINGINSEIDNINLEIEPLSKEKDKLNYSLIHLKEYNAELAEYNEKYNYIEIIKKYTSPTKGGIQNIFMQMYMGKTLNVANELLSLLFDGRLQLLPYIINESEFRIPCQSENSSIINDDISSCSTAERSMISMIISIALLQQSSTIYNILEFDELDGTLDQKNRSNFLNVLSIVMGILKVEHCLMVSHSSEMELSNVDIIWLSNTDTANKTDSREPEGNIIFHY